MSIPKIAPITIPAIAPPLSAAAAGSSDSSGVEDGDGEDDGSGGGGVFSEIVVVGDGESNPD